MAHGTHNMLSSEQVSLQKDLVSTVEQKVLGKENILMPLGKVDKEPEVIVIPRDLE